MQVEQASSGAPVGYQVLPKKNWQRFFDDLTNVLEGRETEIEVIGLDFGDQIEAEWLPLRGLTYDPRTDTFYVHVEDADRDLNHAIAHPSEIIVRGVAEAVDQIAIIDADKQENVIRLREPLRMPRPET